MHHYSSEALEAEARCQELERELKALRQSVRAQKAASRVKKPKVNGRAELPYQPAEPLQTAPCRDVTRGG